MSPIRHALGPLFVLALVLAPPSGAAAAPAPARAPRKPAVAAKPIPTSTAVTARFGIDGSWRLDVAHSDFGSNATSKPRERIDTWSATGPELHVLSNTVRFGGDTLRLDWKCRTDGVAVTNTMMGTPVKTVGTLENGAFHLVFTASGIWGSIVTDEHWTVAADRSTLTLVRETKAPSGSYRQRYVFHPV